MVLGKLPVPGRPVILMKVGQGPTALAGGAGGGGLDIFTLIHPFPSFFLSLGDGPMYTEILSQRAVKPKTTNQPTNFIGPSPRKGKRAERIESKNVQTTPHRTYCKRNRPLSYYYPNCRTPRNWKFTQDHRITRPSPGPSRHDLRCLPWT